MSTLSSASTDAEVFASYEDNASYEEDNSAAKARGFITACRIILNRRISTATINGRTVVRDPRLIQVEQDKARDWLSTSTGSGASQDGGPRVTRVDFRNFR